MVCGHFGPCSAGFRKKTADVAQSATTRVLPDSNTRRSSGSVYIFSVNLLQDKTNVAALQQCITTLPACQVFCYSSSRGSENIGLMSCGSSGWLNIRELVRKNWTKPITEPRTMPPTSPQGHVPSTKSAPQPSSIINATEQKNIIPRDQARPLRRAVSAVDSGS